MSKDNKTIKEIIIYLLDNLGSNIEGKKKIMKLMFLLEHYDVEGDKLTSEHFLGNKFNIYYYGVFSRDVMNTMEEMIREGDITDGFPLKSSKKSDVSLDDVIKSKVDNIIEKFGNNTGYFLEVKTLKMLGIQPHEKNQYFGQSIENILKQTSASN